MAKQTVEAPTIRVGNVYNLSKKPKNGSKSVIVRKIKDGRNGTMLDVSYGAVIDGKFFQKSFKDRDSGAIIRRGTHSADELSEFLFHMEISKMQNEENAAPEEPTVVAVDENGNEINPELPGDAVPTKAKGKGKGGSAKDKLTREQAEQKKTEEREKKKAEKERLANETAAKKRADKMTEIAGKLGVGEVSLAERISGGRVKLFVDVTKEEWEAILPTLQEEVRTKVAQDKLVKATTLSAEEQAERTKLEKVVYKFIDNFNKAAFQIGGALFAINQKRLYRNTHPTFEAYVMEEFKLSRPHAYSLMGAAQTYIALTDGQVATAEDLPSIAIAEAINSGTNRLLRESPDFKEDAEVNAITKQLTVNAYRLAVETAPKDPETGKPLMNTDHIKSVYSVLSEMARTGNVQVDGQDIPVNLAAASVDEMITAETAERVARMKEGLANRIQQMKERAKQNGAGGAGAASNAPAGKGNGQAIPEGAVPKVVGLCSVHGKVAIDKTTVQDLTLGCGCVFVSTPEGYVFDAPTTAKLAKKREAVSA